MVTAHYKKDDLLHGWTSSSDISGYYADIHEGHGTVGAGQGMCELTHGMAGERHGRGMLCVNRPFRETGVVHRIKYSFSYFFVTCFIYSIYS